MDTQKIRSLSTGVNQSGVRDHNGRLILSMLLRDGPGSGRDLADKMGVSSQTASVILRELEAEGLVAKGEPQRGRVGKPSVPMQLQSDGAFAYGLQIGGRSAELILMDFVGKTRVQKQFTYDYPKPEEILAFVQQSFQKLGRKQGDNQRARICGIGVSIPFEIWRWADFLGCEEQDLIGWKELDLAHEIAGFSALPVYVVSDSTAACRAEHVYGRGKEFTDYAYFFIASLVGGGVVLNNTVYEGRQGNAGALGCLRSTSPNGESRQLLDVASIQSLEKRLVQAGISPTVLHETPEDWSPYMRYVEPWIGEVSQELSKAALSTCSVIDFEAVMIDGAFPQHVKDELVDRTQRYVMNQDVRGLIAPQVVGGSLGASARALGAATGPIFEQYFLNTNKGIIRG